LSQVALWNLKNHSHSFPQSLHPPPHTTSESATLPHRIHYYSFNFQTYMDPLTHTLCHFYQTSIGLATDRQIPVISPSIGHLTNSPTHTLHCHFSVLRPHTHVFGPIVNIRHTFFSWFRSSVVLTLLLHIPYFPPALQFLPIGHNCDSAITSSNEIPHWEHFGLPTGVKSFVWSRMVEDT
jgi:hypothetical protein